ncbi:hypothetical protein [Sphingomonas immobilis]|uniref:Uncharacterized protein n=1 Tax=Sphingomonas immobilis TaxID=3063997 RepID=A0ABT8ZXD0_9SPHN|nr:hypothetical protein [Sphingomonas sp. CA1-15]MDO7841147.1 hypothetical protein [Sphingomonas sp. CA1-15]
MRIAIATIGALMVTMGLLWIGQGLGFIMWPASSFMLAQKQWALYGAILAVAGAALIWGARRR